MPSPASVQLDPPSTVRVTRRDWLAAARAILIEEGVDHVRVLSLARGLGVSRSSFYWHYKDRADLLAQLVDLWRESNTTQVLRHAEMPSNDIVEGVLNVFRCWTAASRFDPRLDFALRAWARRDSALHRVVLDEDAACVAAVAALFGRHNYRASEAFVRARIMYFTQIGYYALELGETEEQRLQYTFDYLVGLTGQEPRPDQLARHRAVVLGTVASKS